MKANEFEKLAAEVLANRDARVAATENRIRRSLAAAFEQVRQLKGLRVRELAREMDTSVSQVQRVLHQELGGNLTLRTICRAADCLDLNVSVDASPHHIGAAAHGSLETFRWKSPASGRPEFIRSSIHAVESAPAWQSCSRDSTPLFPVDRDELTAVS